jgi:hypothetical protein
MMHSNPTEPQSLFLKGFGPALAVFFREYIPKAFFPSDGLAIPTMFITRTCYHVDEFLSPSI